MPAKVQDRSKIVSDMLSQSEPIRDLIAGAKHMRSRGRTYLPKFTLENEDDYEERKAGTWLFNGTKKARDDMAGKVFEKPVRLEDQESQLFEWCQNIDLEGRDLSNFGYDVFRGAIEDGINFIFVDAPPREGEITRGEARARNLRPYMTMVRLSSVLGWKWENINNAPTLTQFRLLEDVADPLRDEFEDETIQQIRVLDLQGSRVRVRLYRQESTESAKVGFLLHQEYLTDQSEIQIVPVYTSRTGFMSATPPLLDIAELNLAHWRIQSDKASCLHKSLSPLLLVKGIEMDGGQVVNSAGYVFHSNADNAALEWAEISGSGIKAGADELKALEQQMQWSGLQLIMERSGVSTATGDMLDEGKSTSKLKQWADNLKDALEIALDFMADMGGISGANTTVQVHTDFTTLGYVDMPAIKDMHLAGAISRKAYVREAIRRGILSEDHDADADAELIEEESMANIPPISSGDAPDDEAQA